MKIFNLNRDEWDRTEDREGWRSKDAWVGPHIGSELIGGSMYEVEPGNRLWPFHTHHANEEWVIVLRGEPTLRTHEGEQVLREGDVVAFPAARRARTRSATRRTRRSACSCSRPRRAGHRRVPRHGQDRRAQCRRRTDPVRPPGA